MMLKHAICFALLSVINLVLVLFTIAVACQELNVTNITVIVMYYTQSNSSADFCFLTSTKIT